MTDEPTPSRPGIVWDMGGIIYRYFTEVVLSEAAARGWDLGDVPMGPTGPVPDDDYAAMDRGDIEEPAYVEVVRDRLRTAGVDADPVTLIDWPAEFREPVLATVRAAHARGHPQAVLTNDAARWLGDGWWESWVLADSFEAVLDVSTMQARKPEPAPYLTAAGALELAPTECLFVDDLTVNCKGAEAVGMDSVWFDVTAPERSVAAVRERAGLPAWSG